MVVLSDSPRAFPRSLRRGTGCGAGTYLFHPARFAQPRYLSEAGSIHLPPSRAALRHPAIPRRHPGHELPIKIGRRTTQHRRRQAVVHRGAALLTVRSSMAGCSRWPVATGASEAPAGPRTRPDAVRFHLHRLLIRTRHVPGCRGDPAILSRPRPASRKRLCLCRWWPGWPWRRNRRCSPPAGGRKSHRRCMKTSVHPADTALHLMRICSRIKASRNRISSGPASRHARREFLLAAILRPRRDPAC